MAGTPTLTVKVIDSEEFSTLMVTLHQVIGDGRAWLDEKTPAWVRESIDRAFAATMPREIPGAVDIEVS